MNEEPRHLTDQELEFSIQNQIRQDKQSRIIEESNILEFKKKFNLTYVNYNDYSISIESENWSGYKSKYGETEFKMLCKLDIKDISTFEEFKIARDIVMKEKQQTMTALYWLVFRIFKDDV